MENIHRQLRSTSYSTPCELCSIGAMCIPMLHNNTLEQKVLNRRVSYAKNEMVVEQGTAFSRLFVIHSGCLKTHVTTKSGDEQITGFYLAGDIVALDSIYSQKYNNGIQALTTTLVCEIRYNDFYSLLLSDPNINNMIINLMSEEICNQQKLLLLLSQKKAEERLATFIYSIYLRYSKRGHTSMNIKLLMSRADIANHLGLTIETVSRIFSSLQQQDVIAVKGKFISIKKLAELIKISGEAE